MDQFSPLVHRAAVSTLGYGGFLAGPPVIGLLAEATDLRSALALACLLCVLAAVLAAMSAGASRIGCQSWLGESVLSVEAVQQGAARPQEDPRLSPFAVGIVPVRALPSILICTLLVVP